MKIFETERLVIRRLVEEDRDAFAEMFTDLDVLRLIPQHPFTESQITERFNKGLKFELDDLNDQKCICGIYEKEQTELIGLALFLLDEHNEKELGYRFRVNYWGKGYGTEITKGMLDYYFHVMKVNKVTADVNVANIGSVKILEKFMKLVREFFNERDNCTDRCYEVHRYDWI